MTTKPLVLKMFLLNVYALMSYKQFKTTSWGNKRPYKRLMNRAVSDLCPPRTPTASASHSMLGVQIHIKGRLPFQFDQPLMLCKHNIKMESRKKNVVCCIKESIS